MPDDKGLGSRILGLFVEAKDEAPPEAAEGVADTQKSASEVVAELAGQTAHRQKPLAPAPDAPPLPSGPFPPAAIDFDAVFRTAGMDTSELERVRKAEELLKSLPESTPREVKRQIVEASLKAFGFDVAKIVSAAQNQLKALDTYLRVNDQQTAKALSDAQANIAQLEEKIIGLRAEMTRRTEQLGSLRTASETRKGQVQSVIAFFSAGSPPA